MATEPINPANTPNGGDPEDKITFDEKQQAFINKLIQDKMGKAGSEARAEAAQLREELNALSQELTSAKEALKQAAKAGEPTKDGKDKVEELQRQMEEVKNAAKIREEEARRYKEEAIATKREVEAARQENLNFRKQTAINNAASKFPFHNLEAVRVLTEPYIKWEEKDKKFVVLNDQGSERLNASFEPMTLEEFYEEFANKNKYLVRGEVRPGVGSSESSGFRHGGKISVEQIFGPKSSSKLANDLAKSDIKEYRRLKEIAKAQGLIG